MHVFSVGVSAGLCVRLAGLHATKYHCYPEACMKPRDALNP